MGKHYSIKNTRQENFINYADEKELLLAIHGWWCKIEGDYITTSIANIEIMWDGEGCNAFVYYAFIDEDQHQLLKEETSGTVEIANVEQRLEKN